MSSWVHIWIDGPGQLNELQASVIGRLGLPFVSRADGGRMRLVASTHSATHTLVSAEGYEDDRDFDFSAFRLTLLVEAGSDPRREEAYARTIFDRLAADGRFSLMMTRDVDRLLARFTPPEL